MKTSTRPANYRLGSVYALVTAVLLATQEPFSALAAKRLSSPYFICVTQLALLMSVPLLTLPASARRDFFALLGNARNWGKLAVLFGVGLCGLVLYNVGLSSAHPIITAAILNLSPFWAALVALVVSRKSIPGSPLVFFACFAVAFAGAMLVAWSQLSGDRHVVLEDLFKSILHSRWAFAIPMPLFFALSGTLVYKWFSEFDESATIAVSFVVSAIILIPATLLISHARPPSMDAQTAPALLLLLLGTLAAAAAGRVFYQVALTTTNNDNGFVTMFFLSTPALSSLITAPLSWWISDLRFYAGPMFFIGLALIAVALFLFLLQSSRGVAALAKDLTGQTADPSAPLKQGDPAAGEQD